MGQWVACLLVAALPGLLGAAGIWDRDTLTLTRKGDSAFDDVLCGKVERFPPRYYELRLERVSLSIEKDRFDLPSYDDAGACCAHLGRFGDAMEWMERKRLAVKALGDGEAPKGHRFEKPDILREQSHRRMVNEAAFAVLRWLSEGARKERMDEVSVASGMIHMAREINGKYASERYLEQFIIWIIRDEPDEGAMLPDALGLRGADLSRLGETGELQRRGMQDSIEGLCGLVRGSEAWACVDLFYALSLAYAAAGLQGHAHMARLRAYELIDEGKGSLVPKAPRGEELKARMWPRRGEGGRTTEIRALSREEMGEIREEFARRRAFAKRWQSARLEFMKEKFEGSMTSHPDFDVYFWMGFEAPTAMYREVPGDSATGQPELPPANAPSSPVNVPANMVTPEVVAQGRPVPKEEVPAVLWPLVGGGFAFCALALFVWVGMKRRAQESKL
jgi:hypothetical protein